MKKILSKVLAGALAAACCFGLTACESLEIVGEPTLTVIQEDDGEYTAIVEGYAKNSAESYLYYSQAYVHFYNADKKEISSRDLYYADINRIGAGETWHFYVKVENLPEEPVSIEVYAGEDW